MHLQLHLLHLITLEAFPYCCIVMLFHLREHFVKSTFTLSIKTRIKLRNSDFVIFPKYLSFSNPLHYKSVPILSGCVAEGVRGYVRCGGGGGGRGSDMPAVCCGGRKRWRSSLPSRGKLYEPLTAPHFLIINLLDARLCILMFSFPISHAVARLSSSLPVCVLSLILPQLFVMKISFYK